MHCWGMSILNFDAKEDGTDGMSVAAGPTSGVRRHKVAKRTSDLRNKSNIDSASYHTLVPSE